MPTARAMLRAPVAVAYWLGASTKMLENGNDVIFRYHGTPRHLATQLRLQLRYLRRVFTFVPLASIIGSLGESRRPGERRRAAIIFDDGLRSNVEVAYPVLRSLGIPATFFVCPGLIDSRKWLWTHETRRRFDFAGPGLRQELATELTAPANVEGFVQWMKELELAERERVEARLREATACFVPGDADREAFDLAQWPELRTLEPSVITIGSHSMTHPILPRLSEAGIENEVRESRRILEAKLDRPVEFFSYPNGDLDWRTLAITRRHYRAAIAHGSGMPLDPHLVSSVHLPEGVLRLAWWVNREAGMFLEPSPHRLIRAGNTAA